MTVSARRFPVLLAVAAAALANFVSFTRGEVYFPPEGDWERHAPAVERMNAERLQAAIDFSISNENATTRDMAVVLEQSFGKREPLWKLLGPAQPRGDLTGIIVRHGYVVAVWGEPDRVDMSHSISKTFLSTVVGLAWQRGLIRDVTDTTASYLPGSDLFASAHNARITWEHLLRQTSDWSGTLWGIPDWADRPVGETPADHPNRPMHEPGTYYKYNDVRVNLLALAAMEVWQEPLPGILRAQVMDPIGASDTWHWEGYENSWVEINGRRMQSVSGGGHFGGGMFINAWDLARFGYLFLRNGRWNDQQLVSEKWIALARSPGPANPKYGFCNWFLNTDRQPHPSAPATSVTFQGNGANIVYLDWENDLVVVIRWIDGNAVDGFLGRVLAAIDE